jgi:hypothetical protein
MNKIANTKLILIFLILFSVFGLAKSSQAATATGPLRVLSSNPRYFTDGNGKAVYLTGSHTWSNLIDGGPTDPPAAFDYAAYLNLLQQHDHNFMRMWSSVTPKGSCDGIEVDFSSPFPWQRNGPGLATDGKSKFDLTKFNQAYFDRLRARIIAARDKGIYVSVMLFEGYGLQFCRIPSDGFPLDGSNNINGINAGGVLAHTLQNSAVTSIQENYVKKVIDTVNDLDNVLYEISNEDGGGSADWQYHMINFIKNYESSKPKKHPVGMTFRYKGGTNTELFNSPADWISPNHSDSSPYDYKTNPPSANGNKVIILDTDHLWGVGGDRVWVWKSFLRGHNPIYMDDLSSDSVKEVARKSMGYTLTYAKKMNLAAMMPSASSSDCSTTYCLRNAGKEYFVYQPSSGSFTVNLAVGNYDYEWFNPATGAVASSGNTTATGGNKSFTAPFSGDAVLYLKISSSDTTAPAPPTGVTIQ